MSNRLYTVFQLGEAKGKTKFYQYRYAIEAPTAEEAVRLVVEDKEDILTDDFLKTPKSVAWIEEGYAEEVGNA